MGCCIDRHTPISKGGVDIEMDLLRTSSTKSPHGVINGSGLVLREFLDPMSLATVLLDVKHEASALHYQSEIYSNQIFSHEIYENSRSFPPCISSGLIVSEKCPDGVTSIDDSMDHPIHESVGNTENSRKPDMCSSDDHIHTNHEPTGNTMSFRKRDSSAWGIFMPSYGGITDNELAGNVLESQHHLAAKKMRFMCSLEMDNSATSLSDNLHS